MTNQERALEIIYAFFRDEYGEEDGEDTRYLPPDLYEVPIAYTTDDEYNSLQVYADLVDYRLIYTKGGATVATDNYDNYEEFERLALTQLDFADLIAKCDGTYE